MENNAVFKRIFNVLIWSIITCGIIFTTSTTLNANATPNIPEIVSTSFDEIPYAEDSMTELNVASKNYTANLQYSLASSKPKVAIVSLEHIPFLEGDKNQFFIASKNYTGKVQYQLFYTCESTMGNKWQLIQPSGMVNGWTNATNALQPVKVDISGLNLKADYYRFAIRVKRYGVKGTYSNVYGDYDFAYPFALNVLKNANVNLNNDIKINKNEFTQNEILKINGVQQSTSNIEYQLHLYDVKYDKWITNLTTYTNKIEYNLSELHPGAYVVDVWAKTKTSNNKYDGWKLDIINITNETLPKVDLVSLDHSPFIEGDGNAFYIVSKNYSGKVQYQLFYTSQSTMGNEWKLISNNDMVDGWTGEIAAHEPLKFDIFNLNLKKDSYRFAIRVKRFGVKGAFENVYGDYDNAYPFNLTVEDKNSMTLNGDMIMDKNIFRKNDQLIVNKVASAPENTEYKLHLYDVQNNRWLNNLTDYSAGIDYDLSNIPEGTYILNTWAKITTSTKKYDGWKLKVINITSNLMNISGVEDISATVTKDIRYILPKSVIATIEDGSKKTKAVTWDSEAYTGEPGAYEILGTVLGYSGKVKLILVVENNRGNTTGNILNLGYITDKDNYLYFSDPLDDSKLYKATKDIGNLTKLSDDSVLYLNVLGDTIYYCNDSDGNKIYKIKIDGAGRAKLTDMGFLELNVEGGWIYCTDAVNLNIYKISTDGKVKTKLNSHKCLNLNVTDNYIYYTNASDNNKIYRVKKAGGIPQKINDDQSGYINVVAEWIYYINIVDNFNIYKIKTDGSNRSLLIKGDSTDKRGTFLNANSGYIYYCSPTNSMSLNRVKLDGTGKEHVYGSNIYFPNIIDGYTYYFYYNNGELIQSLFRLNNTTQKVENFGLVITNAENITATVSKGDNYTLPKEVSVKDVWGHLYETVHWNVKEVDTTKSGVFEFEGLLKGYAGKVKATITITE